MHETTSLADDYLLKNSIKIVVADIDYTLIDFARAHKAAIKGLEEKLGSPFSERVNAIFNLINEEHQHKQSESWERKADFDEVIEKIKELEKSSVVKYGVKRWSRESWIIIASQEQGLLLDQHEVENLRDTYWSNHSKNASLYSDADSFVKELTSKNIPLILMTSGDSIMKVQPNLTLIYEPNFSKTYKQQKRIDLLPFQYHSVVIGDPIDKPDLKFFDLIFDQFSKLGKFGKKEILFVGDSPKSDLKVPEELGYSTLLIKR